MKEHVSSKQFKVNQDTYARIFKSLLEGPATAHDLVDESGMHVVTIQSLLRCLHKHKVVHICAWEKDGLGRDATAVFKLGPGHNKRRARMSDSERQARYRAKQRAKKAVLQGTAVTWAAPLMT